VVAGCGSQAAAAADAASKNVRTVSTRLVRSGDAVRRISAVGALEGELEVAVLPRVPERIKTLRIEEGQQVHKGQVLAILSSDLQSRSVDQANAAVSAAEASRDALAQEVERTRKLVQAGAVAPTQLSSLESQLRTSQAQTKQMSAGLSLAAAQRQQAVITAPISGTVANLILREGDMASPSQPLCTLVQGQRLKAVFQVPERDFLQVRPGMPVAVSPLGNAELAVEATVSLRGPVVDRRSRSGRVEISLDNADGALLPGTAVRASIELERRADAILVPASAVLLTADTERSGAAFVFVAEGDVARRRSVQLGARQNGSLEIRSGLDAGELLVVRGQHLLRDGQRLRILDRGRPDADEVGAVARSSDRLAEMAGEGRAP